MKPESKPSDRFQAIINRNTIQIRDPLPQGRQLLNAANFAPADECVLIQELEHGAQVIGLDETVDLREPGSEVFWAFKSDRVFRFTVREHEFAWGDGTIKEPVLRTVAHVKDDEMLVLERSSQPDKPLCPDDVVHLSDCGTEHLRVEKRLVEVFFKDEPYKIAPGVYTTEKLMAQFPIQQGFLLMLQTSDCELVTLQPGQKTEVKCGMRFYEQNPGGGSS